MSKYEHTVDTLFHYARQVGVEQRLATYWRYEGSPVLTRVVDKVQNYSKRELLERLRYINYESFYFLEDGQWKSGMGFSNAQIVKHYIYRRLTELRITYGTDATRAFGSLRDELRRAAKDNNIDPASVDRVEELIEEGGDIMTEYEKQQHNSSFIIDTSPWADSIVIGMYNE
jgi:hypothetical protein